ncbi:hypothetical protein E2C01_064215 [Portunus trituberculatus]|uniref:Uncharacterized protein n=1 Tax=Portunus trituberculatus TaxID=210409 RepID=A0A5B7HFN8_PORTR|nr:hypothetical protein [Portunus trituberculatus]
MEKETTITLPTNSNPAQHTHGCLCLSSALFPTCHSVPSSGSPLSPPSPPHLLLSVCSLERFTCTPGRKL